MKERSILRTSVFARRTEAMAGKSAFISQIGRSYIYIVTRIAKAVFVEKKYLDQ
jgi:hypothetical protein